jgi:hypothetical protein
MTLLSVGLAAPSTDARSLLERMTSLAEQSRRAPGPKVLALLDWIRRNQCSAVRARRRRPDPQPGTLDRPPPDRVHGIRGHETLPGRHPARRL